MIKSICGRHIKERFIKKHIEAIGYPGICSYCKRKVEKKVMDLDDLAEFIQGGISFLYEDAVEQVGYESAEGGYLMPTYSNNEIFWDIGLEMDEKVFDDVIGSIEDIAWVNRDPYGGSPSENMMYDWNYFKRAVTRFQRYTIFLATKKDNFDYTVRVAEILDQIGKFIVSYNLIKIVTRGTTLFRCQQHQTTEYITTAERLTSPPENVARFSNRMSPAGVSMFYGAYDSKIARQETLNTKDHDKRSYTIGGFTTNRRLRLVDLTKLTNIPSIFDNDGRKDYHEIKFLHEFTEDISNPVPKNSKLEHFEYIPTQVVTEYFRYILPEKIKAIDGLAYRSAKDKKGICVVLFFDHETSLKHLSPDPSAIEGYHLP
jgi:hypothetical protein